MRTDSANSVTVEVLTELFVWWFWNIALWCTQTGQIRMGRPDRVTFLEGKNNLIRNVEMIFNWATVTNITLFSNKISLSSKKVLEPHHWSHIYYLRIFNFIHWIFVGLQKKSTSICFMIDMQKSWVQHTWKPKNFTTKSQSPVSQKRSKYRKAIAELFINLKTFHTAILKE